jgi:hypothetical protein
MLYRKSIGPVTVIAALTLAVGAHAAEGARYPSWTGAWERYVPPISVVSPSGLRTPGGQPSFDQTKPWGPGQEAPLTPEYQKVLEESMADQAGGGQGNNFDRARCMPTGMPHNMTFGPLEFVVTPATTYILIGTQARRIFTDGRDWPKQIDPSYVGYSIGRWIDRDGRGDLDLLEVETRGFKGPHPDWRESSCVEGSGLVAIGKEMYVLRGDGALMPAKKDQRPPDLSYFKQ